ncbi:MAG TPA: hypothetical protein VEK15_24540 [Vicinamibacteria bacterium]|nr:hypothetical protein [Vicinamibacteria bacterium]
MRHRLFLLSPANCSGKRAGLLLSPRADFELARRLRSLEGAALGDVFSFMSNLYFRGKLAYARAFARPPRDLPGSFVITPSRGLCTPESPIRTEDLLRFGRVPVDPEERGYRAPLLHDLRRLRRLSADAEFILLGSIASEKYAGLLASVLGSRLLFPVDFVGRGDMSRGGLMLRCAREDKELRYISLLGANRRGPRPARLAKLSRSTPPE